MKNIKARRNGIVAAGSNGKVMNSAEGKFRYAGILAIIAKFRYVAKILFVAKFSALVVLCINDLVLANFISTLVIAFVLVFFCNFPCSEHYISSVKFL